jgi:hypothetical protein
MGGHTLRLAVRLQITTPDIIGGKKNNCLHGAMPVPRRNTTGTTYRSTANTHELPPDDNLGRVVGLVFCPCYVWVKAEDQSWRGLVFWPHLVNPHLLETRATFLIFSLLFFSFNMFEEPLAKARL